MPPDSNTVALFSVIGTAGTAVLVPLINAKFNARADERRFAHERRERDLEERRALLDDCAHALSDYIIATRGLTARFAFVDPETTEEARRLEFYSENWDAAIAAKSRAYELNRRLVIRLGRQNSVVVAYGHVLKMLDEATTDVSTRITNRTMGRRDTRDAVLRRIQTDQAAWDAAHERYLDAATELVGSPSV